jgi:hypothetical protein
MRVIGMLPLRPLPSENEYVNVPFVQSVKVTVPEPTTVPFVTGGASKLPPTLR